MYEEESKNLTYKLTNRDHGGVLWTSQSIFFLSFVCEHTCILFYEGGCMPYKCNFGHKCALQCKRADTSQWSVWNSNCTDLTMWRVWTMLSSSFEVHSPKLSCPMYLLCANKTTWLCLFSLAWQRFTVMSTMLPSSLERDGIEGSGCFFNLCEVHRNFCSIVCSVLYTSECKLFGAKVFTRYLS